MRRTAAITYDGLPVSSGGAHALRTRGFVEGLEALQSFVDAVSVETVPVSLTLEVLEGVDVPDAFASRLLQDFDTRLARTRKRRIGDYIGHQWTIEPEGLTAIVQQLERLRPIPKTRYAGHAAALHATWNLVLCDSSRRQFPHQSSQDFLGFECDGHPLGLSSVYGRISDATTAHLFLSLPFEETTEAQRAVREIQTHFPARLSSRHWKRWTLTKSGKSYVGRKIPGLV